MLLSVVLIVIGFVLLTFGADLLVKGAGRLALLAGISPLVIGLTVVAFGTSAPEAAVSLQAALIGKAGITVGNVVGSNIFNTFVVLGISAMITPLVVHVQVIRKEVPLLIAASFLLLLLSSDGTLSRLDGGILFTLIILYTWWSVRMSRKEPVEAAGEAGRDAAASEVPELKHTGVKAVILSVVLVVAGVVLLVFGSNVLVNGAVAVAEALGVSDLVIGLTIVSVGTSLPELATSIMAGVRGERDIAVGNAVGSSLFNILAVLGLAGLAAPDGVFIARSTLSVDIPVMIFSALACLPVVLTGHKISRGEAAFFLVYYAVYITYIVLDAVSSPAMDIFLKGVLYGLAPVTLIAMIASIICGVRQHGKDGGYSLRK